jgi:hypothetical protein
MWGSGRLPWLVPPLYLLHELEEYWTVLPWLDANRSSLPGFLREIHPANASFVLAAAAVFLLVFLTVAALITRHPERGVWYSVFALLVVARLENGLAHLVQAAVFGGYTPGVITAAVVLIPVSAFVLSDFIRRGRIAKRSLVWMVPAGFAVQALAVATLGWPALR